MTTLGSHTSKGHLEHEYLPSNWQRVWSIYQMCQGGSSYLEGRTTIHEPGRRELPTQSYVRPLSWLDSNCCTKNRKRRPSTSFFWWRPLIEVETSKVNNFLGFFDEISISTFNSTKWNFFQLCWRCWCLVGDSDMRNKPVSVASTSAAAAASIAEEKLLQSQPLSDEDQQMVNVTRIFLFNLWNLFIALMPMVGWSVRLVKTLSASSSCGFSDGGHCQTYKRAC